MDYHAQERKIKALAILGWGLALPGSCALGMGGTTGLLVTALCCLPLLFWFRARKRLAEGQRVEEAVFRQFANSAGSAGYMLFVRGSGIAVNEGTQQLFLAEDDSKKAYAFNRVRSWNVKIQRVQRVMAGPSHGYNLSSQMGSAMTESNKAAVANIIAEREAREASGLFVEVMDVDHPVWHIRIRDEKEAARWNEILTQALRDSRVAASA